MTITGKGGDAERTNLAEMNDCRESNTSQLDLQFLHFSHYSKVTTG